MRANSALRLASRALALYPGDLLNTTTNQTVKDYLTVCQNAYYIVIDFFEQATNAFAAADYKSVLKYEQQTPRAAASCVTIFQTPPTPPNPLNERNRQMRILISMAVLSAFDLVNGP
ncbi:hypothetical protein L1049_020100 [Liquidambar formosana]|uniref:Pectinesterase inhibitor domain-containing protein n=1 Tax=Liquidambar formosana TaxID=63359 RepID=A0AAP0SCM9_LIQFO